MADTMLSFQDQNLATKFMTEDEIRKVCPVAFLTEGTNNVSDKYVVAKTIDVVRDLETLGWYPVAAKQRKPQKNSSGRFNFHLIALQNPDIKITKTVTNPDGTTNEEVDMYPRIILTNSMDGCCKFKLFMGTYRLVCSNGLAIASDKFAEVAIRHINYTFEELKEAVTKFVDALPEQVDKMNDMRRVALTLEQKKDFALKAFKIRKDVPENEELLVDEETLLDILEPVREEDKSDDLWTVFNIVQEKMTKGGFSYATAEGKKARKVRQVKGFVKDLLMNIKLWKLAESYL